MHPVTYFIEDSTINLLTQRFGSYLEQLDRAQIIQVRVLLTNFLLGQEMMGEGYTVSDAWMDSSLHLLVADESVVEVADLLDGVTIVQVEVLLSALQERCTLGNARLKTPTETMTDTLLGYRVSLELATKAAVILKEVDGQRDRTSEEQEIINQVFQLTTKGAA